jgi:low affinity Fe/Cu permease
MSFRIFAQWLSRAIASKWSSLFVLTAVLGTGFYFDFSDAWESKTALIASVLGLLVLFFLQRSQHQSDRAIQLKLDEIVRNFEGSKKEVMGIEHAAESDLEKIKKDIQPQDEP